MTFAVAAAGTGGHVYPGLAVAEALVANGVDRDHIVFFGGDRMEATTIPEAGFPFVGLDVRGFSRSLSLSNFAVPLVVLRAMRTVRGEIRSREVRCVLAMGGYVTGPVALAARRARVPLLLHEQNAHAGLANRLAARLAQRVFVSFPDTEGLDGEVVGNPLRAAFVGYDSEPLRDEAASYYNLDPAVDTLGVFGGSLGAGVLNENIQVLAQNWIGQPLQIVHLAGTNHADGVDTSGDASTVTRRVVGFEDRMDLFYALSDLALTRAGGSLFEVAATGTPALAVPGSFGGGHQRDNAAAMERAGAAVVLPEAELTELAGHVQRLLGDPPYLATMSAAARVTSRPDAAAVVAAAMMEAADA